MAKTTKKTVKMNQDNTKAPKASATPKASVKPVKKEAVEASSNLMYWLVGLVIVGAVGYLLMQGPVDEDLTVTKIPTRTVNSFLDVFLAVKDIDTRYNTDYHAEALNLTIHPKSIGPYLYNLEKLEIVVNKSTFDEKIQYNASMDFLRARRHMLLAQANLYKGLSYGRAGVPDGGFTCRQANVLLSAAPFWNASHAHAFKAMRFMDHTLMYEPSQELIGTGKLLRPRFYSGKWGDFGKWSSDTHLLVEKYNCLSKDINSDNATSSS